MPMREEDEELIRLLFEGPYSPSPPTNSLGDSQPTENPIGDEDYVVEETQSTENPIGGEDDVVEETQPTENSVGEEETLHNSNPSSSGGNTNMIGMQKGMKFGNADLLFEHYLKYANSKGFAVIKRNNDGRHGLMTCDRARKSDVNKLSKKVDCKARLNFIVLPNGECIVLKFVDDHAHELDPLYSPLMPAHRHVSVSIRRQLECNDIGGLRPSKNIRLCEVQNGGPQNIGCTPKDCRNFIDERRRLRLGDGDAEAIRKMFEKLQVEDPNFFYLIDVDSDIRLRNILWIHLRSRAAYQEFHDVISFDTTYLMNRYKMPFGSIVGINHHGQSILLGCALLSHEDIDTFKWMFSNWLTAMGIKKAIRQVMPNIVHRYCIWHILSKLPTKFGGMGSRYKECSKEFKGIVYDSLDTDTFESKWNAFKDKYGLENNEWLGELYRERECWVPVYLHHIFWAGMMSTQRSEGMHAFFDGYIHSRSTLKQFMEQYATAVADKVRKEFKADFNSKYKQRATITQFSWEKQFQQEYTNKMFAAVQEEINLRQYCHVIQVEQGTVNGEEKFKVLERRQLTDYYNRELTYTVTWIPNGSHLKCNCKKFDFKGILCCHIITVMALKNITIVHERYLLDRWKKTVVRPHARIFFNGGYPHMTEEYNRFKEVENGFQRCMDIAMGNADQLDYVSEKLDEIRAHLLQWDEVEGSSGTMNINSQADVASQPLLDPNVVIS